MIEETDIMLYAGFVGVAVDEATGALEPKIGWIARKVDEEGEQLARLTSTAVSANASTPKIKTVPEVLKREKYYKHLHLTFEDKVVVPEWMDDIQIDDFTIEGYMSEAEQAQLKNRFPKAKVNRLLHNITTRRNLAPGQYAYRLDSIVSVASYGTTAAFYLTYDEQGRIAEMLQTTPSNRILKPVKHIYSYDERGFCVGENHYDVVDGKDVLLTEDLITYTDDGRLLKKESKMYDKNGKLYRLNTDSYTYDQRGNLVEQMGEYKMVNSGTVSKRKTTYAYNARNQRIEEVIYGHKTQEDEFFPNITTTREYDQNGRVSHYTTIQTTGLVEDGTIECFIEYTEQNGQVVRETRKGNGIESDWSVVVENRAYDTYGNLVREDYEENDQYYGSANYYYDLATKTENVQGLDWYGKPGMTFLQLKMLVQACKCKCRLMRINGVNPLGDFEGMRGSSTVGQDVRYYYTSLP